MRLNREIYVRAVLDRCKYVKAKDKIFAKDYVDLYIEIQENCKPKNFSEMAFFKAYVKLYKDGTDLPIIGDEDIERVNENTIKLSLYGTYTDVKKPDALVIQVVCGDTDGFYSVSPVVIKIVKTKFDVDFDINYNVVKVLFSELDEVITTEDGRAIALQ